MFDLAVFDWSGTLFADTLAWLKADNAVLDAFGGNSVTLRVYRETKTVPLSDFYVNHGCQATDVFERGTELLSLNQSTYEQVSRRCRLRLGARDALRWFQERDIARIILSDLPEERITRYLKRQEMLQHVSRVLGARPKNPFNAQSKGELLLEYFEQNRELDPRRMIVIGDSPEEVELANVHGAASILISGGSYSRKRLVEAHPTILAKSLGEGLTKLSTLMASGRILSPAERAAEAEGRMVGGSSSRP